MRFFLVSFFTLVAVGIILLSARFWGLGQVFLPFEHDFFKGDGQPLLILKVQEPEQVSAALSLRSDVVVWLDVRMSKDKVLFVLPADQDVFFLNHKRSEQEKAPHSPIMIGPKLSEYTWSDIQTFFSQAPLLTQFYQQFPATRFVLNIVDNVSDVHLEVVKALQDLKPDKRTLIQSDALIVMTAIKALKPEWVYGTSTPDLMRLLSFDSIWILPSTQFKGDVFIAPFELMKRPAFNDDIIAEMRRRHKRVILGPIDNTEELTRAIKYKADGYITTDLPQLLRWLDEHPVHEPGS